MGGSRWLLVCVVQNGSRIFGWRRRSSLSRSGMCFTTCSIVCCLRKSSTTLLRRCANEDGRRGISTGSCFRMIFVGPGLILPKMLGCGKLRVLTAIPEMPFAAFPTLQVATRQLYWSIITLRSQNRIRRCCMYLLLNVNAAPASPQKSCSSIIR